MPNPPDKISMTREEARLALSKLTTPFGDEWVERLGLLLNIEYSKPKLTFGELSGGDHFRTLDGERYFKGKDSTAAFALDGKLAIAKLGPNTEVIRNWW